MELLQDPPSGFDTVVKAYEMARHLPATHKLDLQVGLARGGTLLATGRLDGYRQVALFSEHLRDAGWHEHLLGSEVDMHGCDLLFSHPDDHGDSRMEDPSFIRRAPMQLWGEQLPATT
ncbi:hypothetical protein [Ramlibacter sp.]|uniref:hypothetical protein n=1 Tax=Ramlibacter sp. TaxID=1917967 RepID=UPI002FCC8553